MGSLISTPSKWANIHSVLNKSRVIYTTTWSSDGLMHINNSCKRRPMISKGDRYCFACKCYIQLHVLMVSSDSGTLCYSCLKVCIKSFLHERLFLLEMVVGNILLREITHQIMIMLSLVIPSEKFLLHGSYVPSLQSNKYVFCDKEEYIYHIQSMYDVFVRAQIVHLPSTVMNFKGHSSVAFRWSMYWNIWLDLSYGRDEIYVVGCMKNEISHPRRDFESIYDALLYVKQLLPCFINNQ